jgi:hypothetical protein
MEGNAVVAPRRNADGEGDQLFALLVEGVFVKSGLRKPGEGFHHVGAALPQVPQRCAHALDHLHPIGRHRALSSRAKTGRRQTRSTRAMIWLKRRRGASSPGDVEASGSKSSVPS